MATDTLLQGIMMAFSPGNIMWIVIGVILGMIGGTLPGLSGSTMIAVLLPVMYKMPPGALTMAIIGVYAAATYSSGTAGILYNIPGDAPGVPTTIEGYRLTLQGKSKDALSIACCASLIGNTFGVICMVVLIPSFVYVIAFFGTAERALFSILALVLVSVGVVTREDPFKGLVGMGIGLIMGTVGTQANVGGIRFVGKMPLLWDGFLNLWIILGVYAIPQVMRLPQLKYALDKMRNLAGKDYIESPFAFYGLGWKVARQNVKAILRSCVLGTVIGIIPGIGALTSGWLAYATARKNVKHPELVGTGSVEAIACIESANNAAVPGTLIPMFSLGIPGNTTAAIILSIFILAGLYPGPQMMQQNGDLVWAIVTGCFITGIAFYILAYPFRLGCGKLVMLPINWMIAVMGPLILLGAFLAKNSIPGGNVTLVFALVSIFCSWIGVPVTGLLLGNILCRTIEVDLIRAYQLDGITRFFRPVPAVMILIILSIFAIGVYQNYFSKKRKENAASAIKMVGQGDDDELLTDQDDNIVELDEEQKKLGKEARKRVAENKEAFTFLAAGLIALALGIVVFTMSASFGRLSRLWPRLIATVFLFLPGVILSIRAFFEREKIACYFKERVPKSAKSKRDMIDSWVIYALLIICFNLSPVLGFIEVCALFAFAVSLYLNPKNIKNAVLAFFVIGAFIATMKYGFSFLLPRGPLGI